MREIWTDINGFDGFYQISNMGRVRSPHGMRTISKTRDGYPKIRLLHAGKDVTARVHRLVAEAFIPRIPGKNTVNHIDGNKANNIASNLEWADRHEQLDHAYKLGLKVAQQGDKNCNAKLTEEQVRSIRSEYKPYTKGRSTVALGRKYGVTNRVIGLIVNNKAYTNVK